MVSGSSGAPRDVEADAGIDFGFAFGAGDAVFGFAEDVFGREALRSPGLVGGGFIGFVVAEEVVVKVEDSSSVRSLRTPRVQVLPR